MSEFRCGFVAIVGPTNSGKSTLVNALVGDKVSIVSRLPQTTYHGIRGVLTHEDYQIVFTDTPGFQSYPESIPRLLNRVADRNAGDADLLVWVFDVSNPRVLHQIEKLTKKISEYKTPESRVLVLNKVDLIPKPTLLPLLQQLHEKGLFSEIIPLSAKKKSGVDRILQVVLPRLAVGPAMYDKNQTTDRPREFRIAELIREKIYHATREEVPYTAHVVVDAIEEDDATRLTPAVHATIEVDSSSRKGILIGKQGGLLKKIGIGARKDIETLMGKHICLKLHVKVKQDWRGDANFVHHYLELV